MRSRINRLLKNHCSGSGSYARSSVPDPKLIISDPDPDPKIENQEFRIRILDPDPSATRDGEKKVVNFGDYEDTNWLKCLTFKFF